jgi:GH15 family glucan-1,4-alpha-glucosidase
MEPIENYGIIGNMRTTALVSISGSIDFLCFPSFDSPTVFAALLDSRKGGFFRIDPDVKTPRTKQLYLPDTNILLTRFLSEDGVAEVTDFMPMTGGGHPSPYANQVVRMVRVVRGEIAFHLRCAPRRCAKKKMCCALIQRILHARRSRCTRAFRCASMISTRLLSSS